MMAAVIQIPIPTVMAIRRRWRPGSAMAAAYRSSSSGSTNRSVHGLRRSQPGTERRKAVGAVEPCHKVRTPSSASRWEAAASGPPAAR